MRCPKCGGWMLAHFPYWDPCWSCDECGRMVRMPTEEEPEIPPQPKPPSEAAPFGSVSAAPP